MIKALATFTLLAAATLAPADSPADAQTGRCWGTPPRCPPLQHPVCACNQLRQCTWVCGT